MAAEHQLLNDYGWIPWVLVITTLALWAFSSMLNGIFGGWREHSARRAAAAGAGGAAAGAPGAAVGAAAPGAAPGWQRSTGYVSDALLWLLLLLLVPTVINQFFGFGNETARNLIIAVFSLGLIWALMRWFGHIFHFLARLVDMFLIFIIPLSIAAAVLGLRLRYADD